MKRGQTAEGLPVTACMVYSYACRWRRRKPIIMHLLVPFVAFMLSGCSHLRPPDDYSWKDNSGDPGGLDRLTAAQLEIQQALSDNGRRKVERDFMQNVQQMQRALPAVPTAPPIQVSQ